MVITTKYDLEDNLYFIHRGRVRYFRPAGISCETLVGGEGAKIISYWFSIDEKKATLIWKVESEVFKRKADLLKSL